MRTSLIASLALALALAVIAGCGDDGGFDLSKCGNGTLDSGEECDDGNLADNDACLSTCRANVCGDGFVNTGHEQCEPGLEPNCQDLGLGSGTVLCTTACNLDTSGCTGGGNPTPLPTATPAETGGGTPTPTTTLSGVTGTPTPQPTPVGSVCSGSESIVVTLALDAGVTSAALNLGYGASVNLPGSGTDDSVKERVDFTGSGLTAVNDFDQTGDLVDDTVTTSLVGSDVVPAGTFVTITFDCVGGQPIPTAASFGCTVTSASLNETSVSPACTVNVQ
jgi:cysteine-rich repeat protein